MRTIPKTRVGGSILKAIANRYTAKYIGNSIYMK